MEKGIRLEVVLMVAIVALTALGVRHALIPNHPDLQVESANQRIGLDAGTPNQWFTAWSVGDGQAFALIASDPSGGRLADHIEHEPGYRFARAGFGWLASVPSLGGDDWVPYGLAVASLLSLIGIFWLTTALRLEMGPKAWLLLANPAVFIGIGGDTGETLGVMMLVGAIGFGWYWAAAVLGLTRPSFLLATLRDRRLFGIGVAAAAALTTYSLMRFGWDGLTPSGGRLGLPFLSYFENPSFYGFLLLALAVITIVVGIRTRDWVWVVSGLFVTVFGEGVTADAINAWRAAGYLPVLWVFGPNYEVVRRSLSVRRPASRPA